jgi:hypothetical protein
MLTCSFQVYAAGSEDMDTLTFGVPILLKHLTFSEAKKMPVHEVNLQKALEGLNMDMEQVRAEIEVGKLHLAQNDIFASSLTCQYCSDVIIWTASADWDRKLHSSS